MSGRRVWDLWTERLIELTIRLCGVSAVLFVFGIFFFVLKEGAPILFGELNLVEFFASTNWRPDSDIREVMAYAIHLEKEAVDFYRRMSEGCAGAPMAGIFQMLLVDEHRHIQAIEELYEANFLTDN